MNHLLESFLREANPLVQFNPNRLWAKTMAHWHPATTPITNRNRYIHKHLPIFGYVGLEFIVFLD